MSQLYNFESRNSMISKELIDSDIIQNLLEILSFQTLFHTLEKMSDCLNSQDYKQAGQTLLQNLPPLPLIEFK
jgi:hypothetical protein